MEDYVDRFYEVPAFVLGGARAIVIGKRDGPSVNLALRCFENWSKIQDSAS